MNTKTTETILNILIFIGLVVLLFVVGYPQYKEAQPVKVRIGVDKFFGGLPFHVARIDTTRRYFSIEKVAPEFVNISGDPLEGLMKKEYEVCAVPWYKLLISPSINGDTVKAIGSITFKGIADAIIIPKGTKIKFLKDLNGKKIGYLNEESYLFDLIAPNLAIEKLTKYTKVPLSYDELITALPSKKVDAIFVLEPFRSYLLHAGDTILDEGLINRYIMPSMPYLAIVMRKKFVQDERLASFRMKNVIDGVLGYLRLKPEIGKQILVKNNDWPLDPTFLSNIRMPDFQRLAEVDIKTIETFQTYLVRNGIGTCGIKPQEFLFEKTDFKR
ncbi:MAG: ABC transporter substrate-binding protein [candidate division WOR-3 bacterium]|nr:ABC transporter substrate-binding protein [candidate division WOR-3 bacterium]